MRATVTERERVVRTREWVISADPDINWNEVLMVIGWARQAVVAARPDHDYVVAGRRDEVYDNEIKIRGEEDGSVVVSIVLESTKATHG